MECMLIIGHPAMPSYIYIERERERGGGGHLNTEEEK